MKIFKQTYFFTSLIIASLVLFSCSKDDDGLPDDGSKGLRDRTFDLYVENISSHVWGDAIDEYEDIKAGDKIGTLRLILADDEANYWYDYRCDLEGDYTTKWDGEFYSTSLISLTTSFRFDMLHTDAFSKQFKTEEEVIAIAKEDLNVRVKVGSVQLNENASATVYANLRAEEKSDN